jgi:hypothetical protein
MGRHRDVLARAGAVVVCCAALLLLPSTASADPADDARVVYCLAPAHRADLINAAQSLGIAVPTDPARLPAWRAAAPDDFDRACQALYTAQGPMTSDSSSVFSTLLPFLTGLFGALLTFLAAFWWNIVNRGTALGDDLRAAIGTFHQAGTAYLAGGGSVEEGPLRAARGVLVDKLARLSAEHRRWTTLRTLYDTVTTGELSKATLGVDWDQQSQAQRDLRTRLGVGLDGVRDTGEEIATALRRPLRPHPELRGTGGRP